MNRLLSKLGFSIIATGIRVMPPKPLRNFHQHSRTLEEVRRRNIDVVFDVGANRGFYAHHLRMGGYKGLILSFEPVPECFKELAEKAAKDENWRVFNYALGSTPGQVEFNVIKSNGEAVLSSMLEPTSFDFPTTKISVEVKTLKDVMVKESFDGSHRIFLKMDTQGFDLEVFKGAANSPQIKLLQSEVAVIPSYDGMPTYLESLTAYQEAGFQLIDTFEVCRRAEYLGELDVLLGR